MAEIGQFAHAYHVELLCQRKATISKPALLEALKRRLPAVEPLDGTAETGILQFAHPDHPVSFEQATLPAQTLVAALEGPLDLQSYEGALRQSWLFPEARQRVTQAVSAVVVTDQMASPLPHGRRLALFQDCVAAVLEVVPCEAIYWPRSQEVTDPRAFLARLRGGGPRLFAGGVNVRLFNVAGSPGALVMDTMGLAAFGLPDVQCHFRNLPLNDVAPQLYDIACYLFEKGDVIADGQTVDGVPRGARWRCHHRHALIAPDRLVLDLDPGPAHSAN